MNQTLPFVTPEPLNAGYLFDIKFDGDSFGGAMEIGVLASELRSLNYCLSEIVVALRQNKRFDLKNDNYEIVVEAFQKNCFKKRIKLVIKGEKHPTISIAITTILMGVINAIPLYRENNKISPKMMQQIEDKVALKLLDSDSFRKGISDIVAQPLKNKSDEFYLIPPPESNLSSIKIPYDSKENYLEEGNKNAEKDISQNTIVSEVIREDLIYGKIIAIDLDATKHQIDFKIYGEGRRINGTLSGGLDVNDYKMLLGEFVEIKGLITETDGIVTAMEIKSINKSEEPGQKTIF